VCERHLPANNDLHAPTPLVSVVIPAFNAAAFIASALDSVLRQTVTSLEVVVVDDGSQDRTAELVEAFVDPRVRLVQQTRSGPSVARNTGCTLATAREYIAFLDADDEWDPLKLAEQLKVFRARPEVVAVGSLMRYVSATGRTLGRAGQPLIAADQNRIRRGELCPFPMSSVVVRRRALSDVGGFDDALGRVGSEDLDVLARLSEIGEIACVAAPLGSYRVHASSTMATSRRSVNQGARFVRRRQAARHAGYDLSWEAFAIADRVSWQERRQDLVERQYRRAALCFADRKFLQMMGRLALSAAIDLRYTVRRLARQSALAGYRTERAR
jgi:glycosyltransferase involved in cell wall biosynthesis